MDYPHRRVVTVRTSCSNQAVLYIVLSPLACHTMCWHFPTDDVGHPYTYGWLDYVVKSHCHVLRITLKDVDPRINTHTALYRIHQQYKKNAKN